MRFWLYQSYPNPFNPSTTIGNELALPSAVRLEVFDLLGRRAATLVNEEQPAGFHQATWRCTVRSGAYLYQPDAVASGSLAKHFTEGRKMLGLK